MLIQLLINALAFYVTGYILPGFMIYGWQPLLVMSVVWGLLTTLVKPLLVLFTLPITIVTLGLFSFFINALLLLLLSAIVPGFTIDTFGTAILGSIILSVVNMFLTKVLR